MPAYVLDANGLQTPRYPEARALVVERWRARFGENAQTGSDSPDGLLIDTIALNLALAWEGVAATHAASYFRTSTGLALDLVLDEFGRRRIAASPSRASAVWYGDPLILVASGALASVEDTQDRFATDADATTSDDGTGGAYVVRILDAVDADTYAIDIDNVGESVIVAAALSTTEAIAQQLADQLTIDNPLASVLTAGSDPDGAALIVVEGIGSGVLTVGPSATDPANQDVRYGVRVGMTASNTGPTIALAGTLNTTQTSIANIDGVCTTADATIGRRLETDSEFRARHIDQINSGGNASAQAIRARALALVDSVGAPLLSYARAFANNSDFVDASGRPPHSVELVWVGPAGADVEQSVAESVFSTKAAGIEPFGTLSTVVLDDFGSPHAIGHSRGVELYLHLDIAITPGEGYPTVGDPLSSIRDAIVAFFAPRSSTALALGADFYPFSLGEPINVTVPGVADATITSDATAAPGDIPTLVGGPVVVAEDTILLVDSSRVSVHL